MQVADGDTIFVLSHPIYLELFFDKYHPQIKHSYILVTALTDDTVPGKFEKYLEDKKIIKWFSTNIGINNPKLLPIPIGIPNPYLAHGNINIFNKVMNEKHTKKSLLLLNFMLHHPRPGNFRHGDYNQLSKLKFAVDFCKQKMPLEQYLRHISQSKFVASPQGGGLDCHRTWEILLMGSFPIVKRSLLDPLYYDLPVVIVDNWSDISEEFLNDKYEKMITQTYNYDKIWAPYWLKFIDDDKN